MKNLVYLLLIGALSLTKSVSGKLESGIVIQSNQNFINKVIDASLEFIPKLLKSDEDTLLKQYLFPKTIEFKFGLGRMLFGLFNWDVVWDDVRYKNYDDSFGKA